MIPTRANFQQAALRTRPRHYRSSLSFDRTRHKKRELVSFFFLIFPPPFLSFLSSGKRIGPACSSKPDRFPGWDRERAGKTDRSNVRSDARECSSATSFVRSFVRSLVCLLARSLALRKCYSSDALHFPRIPSLRLPVTRARVLRQRGIKYM